MKRVFGYILMGLGVLALFVAFMTIVEQYFENNGITNLTLWFFWIISIIIPISLYILGRWLVRRSKNQEDNLLVSPKEIYFDRLVQLNFKLTFKEYCLGLAGSFSMIKILFILLPILGIIQFFLPWVLSETGIGFEKDMNLFSFEYFNDKSLAIFLIFLPLAIFLIMKLSFKRNKNLQQNIAYRFNEDAVLISGNNFESKLYLNGINRIKITKNYVLLFFLKKITNIIPKRVFQTVDELNYFISVLKKES